ncbi:MAG TPA: hypothetical protein RMG45_17390, partial [Polyangiaceae bacterium LLY-WYZ-15_(1-7)]|nr:hypothetical protein [Polyangiaceae bacterium LLY-WYZ-15_(1-7)]
PRRESERAWVPGVVTLAAGAAVLGAGLGVGLAAQASEDDWLATSPGTREEVQEALGLRDEAQRRATTANTLFVVGGLTLATGAALLFLLRGDDDETRATLAPAVGPRGLGLQLRGSL